MSETGPPEYVADITAGYVEDIQFFIHSVLRPATLGPHRTDVQRTALALLIVVNEEAANVRAALGDTHDHAQLNAVMAGWNRLGSVRRTMVGAMVVV